MSKAPSMPMYWDAYLADTTHLTTEEHGAYMLLLAAMWRRNGWVPDDDKDNARILGLTVAKWKRIKLRLSDFLIQENDSISQKKLLETWEKTQEKIAINAKNGAKGGRAAASKNKDLAEANATNSLKRKASIPEPEPLREETTNVVLSGSPDDVAEAARLYVSQARLSGWPSVRSPLSKARVSALRARLKECGGISGWVVALEKAAASGHCCGENDRGWVCNFDFLTKQSSFSKLMEGNYDNRNSTAPTTTSGHSRAGGTHDSLFNGFAQSAMPPDRTSPACEGDGFGVERASDAPMDRGQGGNDTGAILYLANAGYGHG